MASLLAACRKNFPAAYGLHARAKPVRLGAASLARLIGALWQNNPPLLYPSVIRRRRADSFARDDITAYQPLQRQVANYLVYSTLAHTVKKPARTFMLRTGKPQTYLAALTPTVPASIVREESLLKGHDKNP
jgi:hypothetical protein